MMHSDASEMTGRPLAFLDRDGTLIRSSTDGAGPVPRHAADDIEFLPGVVGGCRRLKGAGFGLVLVTNQPDVARGTVSRSIVEQMNDRIGDQLGLDLLVACFHDDADDCHCRKPRPGMLIDGARMMNATLSRACVLVGDRWRDVDAGRAAGVTTVFLDHGYTESKAIAADYSAASFSDCVQWIIDRNLEQ